MIGLIKQHDVTDCGAACLASIAVHYKLKLPIAKIRQYASTDVNGTNILGLKEAACKMGFEAKGVKGTLFSLAKIPLPAIAHIVTKNQLHHYVVISKVSKKDIRFMDPSDGTMHHKLITEFTKAWTGVLLLLIPTERFTRANEKTHYLLHFWQLIRPHKSVFFQILFGAFIYTILGLSTAIFVQKITDYVLVDGNRNLLNLMGITMIIILLLQLFITVFKNLLTLDTGQQIDARLILGYYRHLLKLPQQFFDTMRIGEIISRVNDAVKIRTFINDISVSLAVNVFIIVFSFALLFTYYWKLALLMLFVIPLYLTTFLITNALYKKIQRKLMEDSARLESQIVESLTIIGTIKRLGIEEFIDNKTETRFIRLLRTTRQSSKLTIFSGASLELISRLLTIFLLWVGTGYVLDNEMTPGELFSFYTVVGYFTSPAAALIGASKTIQEAIIAADRLFEIIDLEIERDTATISLTREMVGNICFKNVAFRYGTRINVFENLTLNIQAGSFTAIVGASGSGKSTLAALLQNIYPIQNGSISIGKYAIKYINNVSLRKLLGVVPQRIDLLAGNVIDNIAVGDSDPDMQRIIDICTQLGIINFIESLPEGFETHLGENGIKISGGQKQRIAIARAIYRNPEILILDEATSSLDHVSEKYVQSMISILIKQQKTIIVITHRLFTIRNAHHIIVLDKGQVVEQGSHEQMLNANGLYAKLWRQEYNL